MYNIVLIGPPGGGKGTQAKKITAELNIPHISTGDLFRAIMKDDSNPLTQEIKKYVNSGKLVPDEIVVDLVMDRINQDDCDNGYLLDGFPRSLPQAKILDEKLDEKPLSHVILIDVEEELLMKRLTGRRIAKNAGTIYNIYFNPPKVEGKDDATGEELYQRDDDKPETVKKRLQVYKDQTIPSVEYYRDKGILQTVDGSQDIEDVYNDIKEVLGI